MPRANLTTASVLRAAADAVDVEGYDSITLSALARRLGVQPASLYGHVRDRSALLEGVHVLALGELADAIGAAVAGRSARDALIGLADAQRDYAREHPGRWSAIQRPDPSRRGRSPEAARLRDLSSAVLRAYDLPDDEFAHANRMVGATLNGFIELERGGAFSPQGPDPDVSWRRTLDALHLALESWPTD